ncbi:DciA family protein [Streptomyces sp. NPDC059582]|uniref:DciA family protein n=1 Tax=Streptomyces sp. NPDC059582 TaxID=3346875 RepID=UPI003680DD1D
MSTESSPTTAAPGSGADLARQALAAARAAAKTKPAAAPKKSRRSMRPSRGEGRDPQGLGSIMGKLKSEQGWDAGIDGGSLLDQWAKICPTELAPNVRPTAYDPDRGLLTLQPSSPAYATRLRMSQQLLARHLNNALGKTAVRAIRVLPPGGRHDSVCDEPTPEAAPAATPEAPVKTRESAHPGYRHVLSLALENRTPKRAESPYVEEARARQEAALRANRQPEAAHREAYWAEQDAHTEPRPGSMAASEAAALAYKRSQKAGPGEPRRAFDVA